MRLFEECFKIGERAIVRMNVAMLCNIEPVIF